MTAARALCAALLVCLTGCAGLIPESPEARLAASYAVIEEGARTAIRERESGALTVGQARRTQTLLERSYSAAGLTYTLRTVDAPSESSVVDVTAYRERARVELDRLGMVLAQ